MKLKRFDGHSTDLAYKPRTQLVFYQGTLTPLRFRIIWHDYCRETAQSLLLSVLGRDTNHISIDIRLMNLCIPTYYARLCNAQHYCFCGLYSHLHLFFNRDLWLALYLLIYSILYCECVWCSLMWLTATNACTASAHYKYINIKCWTELYQYCIENWSVTWIKAVIYFRFIDPALAFAHFRHFIYQQSFLKSV